MLASILRERGIDALIAPVMEILRYDLELPSTVAYQAALLTSGNAVDALADSTLETDLPIFCVGDATARKLVLTSFPILAPTRQCLPNRASRSCSPVLKVGRIYLKPASIMRCE